MNYNKIAIKVLLASCFSLTACGLKGPIKPEADAEVIYPRQYPKPLCDEVPEKVEDEEIY